MKVEVSDVGEGFPLVCPFLGMEGVYLGWGMVLDEGEVIGVGS